ncbi:hypothetical protein [Desulfocucumis palustris]|uniref:hypothetical protein n=1 Tax=Desulfocucumis palustris TaxID=1898651 RepID=UPI000CEA049A|nr:hypothetical protein [Desulfocucumis palustris]
MISKGQKLIHLPTGRPVVVAEIAEDSFTVNTTDDIWPHPKTGKPWGGCSWILLWDKLEEFKNVETG